MQSHAFETQLGGIMTDEVGSITGSVQLSIDENDPMHVQVAYEGSTDLYTVTGSPIKPAPLELLIAHLTADAGLDEYENPRSNDLTNFS